MVIINHMYVTPFLEQEAFKLLICDNVMCIFETDLYMLISNHLLESYFDFKITPSISIFLSINLLIHGFSHIKNYFIYL